MNKLLKYPQLPNILTGIRILLVPVIMILIAMGSTLAAGILFCLAALTDFADGYLARKNQTVSNLGKFMDPVADKALVVTTMIMLCGQGSLLPAWLVCIVVLRDLLVDGLRMQAAAQGTVIAAGPLGKVKTVLQMLALIALLFGLPGWLCIALMAAMGVMTVWSGADYLWKGRKVILG